MSRILAAVADLSFDPLPEDDEDELYGEHDEETAEDEESLKTEEHRKKLGAALTVLTGKLDVLNDSLRALQKDQIQTVQAIRAMAASLKDLKPDGTEMAALMQSVKALTEAVTAPKELVRDADGKPVGVKIKGT